MGPCIALVAKSPDIFVDILLQSQLSTNFMKIRPPRFHTSYRNDTQYLKKFLDVLGKCSIKNGSYRMLGDLHLMSWPWNHSHKKRKDSLEGSLDRVLLAAELEFLKILVRRLYAVRSEFESRCCHLNLRYHACFEQGLSWYSDNYRV